MSERDAYIKQEREGNALKELQNHQGWSEFVSILSDMYIENVRSLIDREGVDTRSRLKSIEEVAERIKLKIDFAQVASEELKTEKFKLQDTP